MATLKHNDCRNFVTVDVTKGICRRRGEMVAIDSDVCDKFEALPKCKNCAHFAANGEEHLGTCSAENHKPWTYEDLIAVTCEMYAKK